MTQQSRKYNLQETLSNKLLENATAIKDKERRREELSEEIRDLRDELEQKNEDRSKIDSTRMLLSAERNSLTNQLKEDRCY